MKRRLLVSYLSLTLFVLAILEIPLGVIFAREQLVELTTRVERDAVVLASVVEDALEAGAAIDVSDLLQRYSRDTGGRIVIVNAAGVAVADSSDRGVGTSFTGRREVAQALTGRVATGTRRSVTLGADLLYVAVPVASGGAVHGAVRITYPTSALDARVRRSWLTLAAVGAVSLLAAGLLAAGMAGWVSRPLRRLQAVAAEVGRGRLDARAPTGDGPPEVRALAAAFNDSAQRIAGLLTSQDAFVADASHQLRSPLTALQLRLENLEAGSDGVLRDDLRAAISETRRLSRTVDQLLALARADRAAGTPPAGLVDPLAVLEERREAWVSLADERGVALTVAPTGRDGLRPVRATPDRLAQVLDNLLANAIDAAPAGSAVVLQAVPAPTPGWIELHVLDRGPGLTDEERVRAFDRFWRGRPSDDAEDRLGGSGLGLPIARRLVTADGGELELVARPGGGTDAVIRLVAAEDASPAGRNGGPGRERDI